MSLHITHRWSAVCLVLLAFLAIAGPGPFGLREGIQAPPYSKPEWLDRSIAPTVTLPLRSSGGTAEASLTWNYAAPLRVALTGRLDEGAIRWKTPRDDFLLTDVPGELDLDARDISFKKALGLRPFDDMPSVLLPSAGEYRLSLTGKGDVALKIEGGRWGWLGTDQRGRDVAALFLRGIRV